MAEDTARGRLGVGLHVKHWIIRWLSGPTNKPDSKVTFSSTDHEFCSPPDLTVAFFLVTYCE